MPKKFLFNVYDGDKLIVKEKSAAEIERILDTDRMHVSKCALHGYKLRRRYRIVKAEVSPFYDRFGIKPEVYDRAMKEFLAKGGR